MLRSRAVISLIAAVALSACTSVRVSGFVTDEVTGEPVSGCGVALGPFYANTDAAGHFTIKGRKKWKEMHLTARGYQTKSVSVDSSDTRYPVVKVQLAPKEPVLQGVGSGPPD